MQVLFKKEELNKKYIIKSAKDKKVVFQSAGYSGMLSDIPNEKILDTQIEKGCVHIGLKKEEAKAAAGAGGK